ncbi:hypothetical protein BV20DRAFT_976713 [Pilatotrama ljubarskyi]|nr:hypothetical protein BV20DRAFT_976713 [Pilatotrama ljubarskyi]
MSETQTITLSLLDLPRPPKSSASDDSFTALMDAVLDPARSSGSLESNSSAASTAASTSTSASLSAPDSTTSVPSLAASGRTDSTSSCASSTSTSASASAASSTTPSPCPSILRSSSSNLTLPSRTGSPSITFAPLPTTEPRKRNSPHPLGVAARSRLLRHRRMLREHGLNPDEAPYPYGPGSGVMNDPSNDSIWGNGDERPVEVREAQAGVDADEDARAVGSRGGRHRTRAASDPAEGDALVSLGRLVKGAGKSLWRSISMKDVRAREASAETSALTSGSSPTADGAPQPQLVSATAMTKEKRATLPRKTEVHLFDDPDARPPSAEGGVWEEEVEQESWKKLLSKPPASPDSDKEQLKSDLSPRASVERLDLKAAKRISRVEVIAARVR